MPMPERQWPEPDTSRAEAYRAEVPRLWVERLLLTEFRNYRAASVTVDARPVVITGANGAGKTNLLEAVSLLAGGSGLRRAAFADMSRNGNGPSGGLQAGRFAVAARVNTHSGPIDLGTGTAPLRDGPGKIGRVFRVNGTTSRSGADFAERVRVVWLTPAMDGLFTGPASDRRAFLDRLITSLDGGYRAMLARYERAMRQRNRLLATDRAAPGHLDALEADMAATGVAVAAIRLQALAELNAAIGESHGSRPDWPFPEPALALDGAIETALTQDPAARVEDGFQACLARSRNQDASIGRTLHGPHRTDLIVHHRPKAQPARLCSTGEQKALLTGLVLAQARRMRAITGGVAPLILLDEIAAHFDGHRRAALFSDLIDLGAQAWMTGTDLSAFQPVLANAQRLEIVDGRVVYAS